jgi:hypothetical protein
MRTARSWLAAVSIAAGVWAGAGGAADAVDVTASVRDQQGEPVEDAVVSAVAEDPTAPPA